MKARIHAVLVLMALSVVLASAQQWPGYYGPNRDGTSPEKGILRAWPKDGPKVLWTVPVGRGYAGPAIAGGKVYLLDRDDSGNDTLRCLDFATGKELWNFTYAAPGKFDHNGSRSTPTVEGNNVYTCGPLGDLYCVDANSHKPLWHKNVWTDFGGSGLPTWAITQNPLVYRDLLIVAAQAPEASVVAYDKLTGELKWKSAALPGGTGYVTPSLVKVAGEDHLVMITAAKGRGRTAGGGGVSGLDPLTGKLLWSYANWQCGIPVPHAVDAGESRVLITGGYNAGSALIKVTKATDGSYGVTEIFKTVSFGAHTQPPLLYKNHFYAQYTTNERSDGLVCLTLDGQVKWKTGEDPAFDKGGMILADGVLLAVDGNTKVYVIEPDPAAFKPLASATLLEPGENWAPIALSDGKLLIRDQKQMKCVQVSGEARPRPPR
ncbi:MAG: PQQ-binding-like beta-propeller repeat protein [Bacteroidales bacterium]